MWVCDLIEKEVREWENELIVNIFNVGDVFLFDLVDWFSGVVLL